MNKQGLKRKAESSDLSPDFNTTIKIVQSFLSKGPNINSIKLISFELLPLSLRDESLVAITKECLQRIHLLSTIAYGSPIDSSENINVRTFLTSYAIAYHTSDVFESMGAVEKELFNIALSLTTKFENICNEIISIKYNYFEEIPQELTKNFSNILFEYFNKFKAWHIPDKTWLLDNIKKVLAELYKAQSYLLPNDSRNLEINNHISILRGKFIQYGGID